MNQIHNNTSNDNVYSIPHSDETAAPHVMWRRYTAVKPLREEFGASIVIWHFGLHPTNSQNSMKTDFPKPYPGRSELPNLTKPQL